MYKAGTLIPKKEGDCVSTKSKKRECKLMKVCNYFLTLPLIRGFRPSKLRKHLCFTPIKSLVIKKSCLVLPLNIDGPSHW